MWSEHPVDSPRDRTNRWPPSRGDRASPYRSCVPSWNAHLRACRSRFRRLFGPHALDTCEEPDVAESIHEVLHLSLHLGDIDDVHVGDVRCEIRNGPGAVAELEDDRGGRIEVMKVPRLVVVDHG